MSAIYAEIARGWLGHVRERYEYDVYGQPTIRHQAGTMLTASAYGNRFLFQGRDRDPDTGLYHFRYRTYSPTLGRFLERDLIRERGGLNLYASFANQPTRCDDPKGLTIWKTHAHHNLGARSPRLLVGRPSWSAH